jgi:hypothetical protein
VSAGHHKHEYTTGHAFPEIVKQFNRLRENPDAEEFEYQPAQGKDSSDDEEMTLD